MSYLGKLLLSAGKMYVPTTLGEAWQGGFYAGRIRVDGNAWAVVCSPLASGYNGSTTYHPTAARPDGLSAWDGNANHALLMAIGSPMAAFCNDLTIGGFTDWHIPSEAEIDLCYRAFRPVNAPNTAYGSNPYADPPLGNYTSTDPEANNDPLWSLGGSEAWTANVFATSSPSTNANRMTVVNFNGGVRLSSGMSDNRMVRATRLVKIPN